MESIFIETLTPLWTGDIDRKCSKIKETSIIGSLRWWYEALVRGLGGGACDPTSDDKCELNHKKFKKALESKSMQEALDDLICPACQLFGCTGWSRKFRLEVDFDKIMPELSIKTRKKRRDRYLPRKIGGFVSKNTNDMIELKFFPLREITKDEWALLNRTFEIIEKYGALGAHLSQGNGVIDIIENNLPKNELHNDLKEKKNLSNISSPDLRDFFFYKFQLNFEKRILELINEKVFWIHPPDESRPNDKTEFDKWIELWNKYLCLPIAFHIRDTIRMFELDRNKRHSIFGRQGSGSKVFVSHGYKIDEQIVEVRIWGYEDEGMKDKIKNKLQFEIKNKLFSSHSHSHLLRACSLVSEKSGKDIVKEVLNDTKI